MVATLAVLIPLPWRTPWATILIVALAPLAIVPKLQLTVVEPLQLPAVVLTETSFRKLGNVSVITALLAMPGP